MDAFMALVDGYDDILKAYVFGIVGDAFRMDDVMQETTIKAYRSLGSFNRKSSFKTWIYRIAHNTALDDVRRNSKVVSIDPATVHQIADSAPSISTSVAGRLDIQRALERLTPAHRTAVLMIDAHGFDYSTAAEIIGVPRGTVASRVNEARSQLRRLLDLDLKDQL